jgi:hypothetical protein
MSLQLARELMTRATEQRSARAGEPDLGLEAQIMLESGPGSGLVQIITMKLCIEHSGILGPFSFRKENT